MIYTREEAYEATLKYFNGDELATKVWLDKYALKDKEGTLHEKTPDDMHKRLAKEFVRVESNYPNPISEEEIYELLKDFKYIVPQGSPMYGIGNDFVITSLSNCFVVDSSLDSYGGILRIDQEQVQLMKRRGGVGHDLSNIRPSGALANNSVLGCNAGMPLYMNRFSNSTREVSQDGRRGALMLSVDVRHPDTEKFIDSKLEEGRVAGANISVKLSDEFMESVINEEDFIQRFPVNIILPATSDFLEKNKYRYNELYFADDIYLKKIKSIGLWNKIVHNAWKSAEPGILFWDKILSGSPANCYGEEWEEKSTNPCFSGRELLLTDQGYKTFAELESLESIKIINKSGEIVDSKVWRSGNKKTIKFSDYLGNETVCTPDHIWMLNDGTECEAKDLKGKRLMPDLITQHSNDELYVKLGFIQGDGNLSRLSSKTHKGFEINFGKEDLDVIDLFGYTLENDERAKYTNEFYKVCNELGFSSETLPNRRLPFTFKQWSDDQKLAFLKGLYSANGSVIKGYRISFKSTCKDLILEIKKLLLGFNIDSYCTTNKSKYQEFSNGVYEMKESYDLNISNYKSMHIFYKLIGFVNEYKMNDLSNLLKHKSPYIKRVEDNGFEDVYDFTEPKEHWGVVSGFIAHNCGEIPLCPYDSCRLLAINLYSYVNNPFTKKASFDFDKFKQHVRIAQRLMDDLVDLEIEKLDKIISKIESDKEPEDIKSVELNLWKKIKQKAVEGRRTGLGITAEGDMLAALELRYGTKEATEFSEEVHKMMAVESYKSSIEMAKERGSFPIWSFKKEINNPFIDRIYNELSDLEDFESCMKYQEFGRRNIANLTIAPTGSVSILTQTTSGIESVFKVFYKRRKKTDDKSKCVFVDEVGDMWEEFSVFHHKFIDWWIIASQYEHNPEKAKEILYSCSDEELNKIIKQSPYYKATSEDVDYIGKVELQGKVQKWIDHSISVTVNMPNNVTEEMASDVYKRAWEVGCKGITIYRDGSRAGVLVSDSKEEKKENNGIIYHSAPKRPKAIECDIYSITRGKQPYTIIVGLLEGKPYEIFALEKLSNYEFPDRIKAGKITKVKSKTYELIGFDGDKKYVVENIIDFLSDDEKKDTRKFSAMLRHGMHPKYMIDQINEYSLITSFDKVIAKALANYLGEEKLKEEKKCPNCEGSNIRNESGCLTCMDCGWSKCG